MPVKSQTDATVAREVRRVLDRETAYIAVVFDSDNDRWHLDDDPELCTEAQCEAYVKATVGDVFEAADIIRIPGTVEAAYLKERAGLMECLRNSAIALTGQYRYNASIITSEWYEELRGWSDKIDALDAAHKGGE